MPSTILTRNGLLATFDPTGVPDNTELNGFQDWVVYESGGPGNGFFKIISGEIVTTGTLPYGLALWGNADAAHAGHCVRADVGSANWTDLWPGLAANAKLDHSEVTQAVVNSTLYELRHRDIIGDYGAGFPISTGANAGGPIANGTYVPILLASVQQVGGGFHPRGGLVVNNTVLALSDSTLGLLTGINDGTLTYPGLNYWQAAGIHWRNYKVYADYRISVTGLSGTQAFRIYDAGGGVLLSSAVQSATEAHVLAHLLTWPFTGHLQIFVDNTFTPGQEVPGGRFPAAGTASFQGGNVYALSTLGAGIQINFDLNPDFPAEWFDPVTKDVTLDCIEYDILQIAGNPRVEVDTATIVLLDPDGKYVPARPQGSLYPLIRLGRPIRMVFEEPEGTACRFYGKIAAYRAIPFDKNGSGNEAVQRCEIRAESPMREIANSENTLTFAFVGPLVNADGSGVISSILDLVADIIPLEVRQLEPTPDVIPEGFLSVGMTVQTALEQCAIYSDSMYFVVPHWKVSPEEPNYFFAWLSRDAVAGQTSDHFWSDDSDDIHDIDPIYSADVL